MGPRLEIWFGDGNLCWFGEVLSGGLESTSRRARHGISPQPRLVAPNADPSDHQRRAVHEHTQGRIKSLALRLQENEQGTLIGCYLAIPSDPRGKPGGVYRLNGIVRDNLNLLARQMGNGTLFRGLFP